MSSPLIKRKNARVLLIQGLYQWMISANEPTEIVAHSLAENDKPVDIEYFREGLYKIVEECATLDQYFSPYLSRDIKEVSPIELAILRVGAFELAYRLDIPYRVAINEATENTKVFGAEAAHKFVNGVLDKVAKKIRQDECAVKK